MSEYSEREDVYLRPETVEAIEDMLEYGESKSGWIREACHRRLDKVESD